MGAVCKRKGNKMLKVSQNKKNKFCNRVLKRRSVLESCLMIRHRSGSLVTATRESMIPKRTGY